MPVLALLLAACVEDPHTAARRNAERVDAVAHQIGASVSAHCTEGLATPAGCPSELQVYSTEVGSKLDVLRDIAPEFDDDLQSLGLEELADVGCGILAMSAELERHGSVACAAADTGSAAAELVEHCAAMLDDASQLHARAESVMRVTTHVSYSNSGSMSAMPRQRAAPEHAWQWGDESRPEPTPMCEVR